MVAVGLMVAVAAMGAITVVVVVAMVVEVAMAEAAGLSLIPCVINMSWPRGYGEKPLLPQHRPFKISLRGMTLTWATRSSKKRAEGTTTSGELRVKGLRSPRRDRYDRDDDRDRRRGPRSNSEIRRV